MQILAQELQIVIAATALLFILTSFVAVFIIIQQQRHNKYLSDKKDMQTEFAQEILKAQLEMQERTLHTVGQEIHDNIGQLLSLAKLNLNTIDIAKPDSIEKLGTTRDLVGQAIEDLRTLSKTLNSDFVQNESLSKSLKFELDIIEKTGLYKTNLEVVGNEIFLEPQKQLIIFRIAQESISNIIKHAEAQSIQCKLLCVANTLTLTITDDGKGFDTSNKKNNGTGLHNIRHRARLIEAELAIDSVLGEGTTLTLSTPFQS